MRNMFKEILIARGMMLGQMDKGQMYRIGGQVDLHGYAVKHGVERQ
jgi:hypothetical protein